MVVKFTEDNKIVITIPENEYYFIREFEDNIILSKKDGQKLKTNKIIIDILNTKQYIIREFENQIIITKKEYF